MGVRCESYLRGRHIVTAVVRLRLRGATDFVPAIGRRQIAPSARGCLALCRYGLQVQDLSTQTRSTTTSSVFLGSTQLSYPWWVIGSVEQINLLVVLTPQVARILGQKELNVTSPRAKYSPPRIRSTTVGLLVNTRHSPLNDAKYGYACRHRLGQEHKQFSGGRQSARCVLEPELLLPERREFR
jgi:hypothetical protein